VRIQRPDATKAKISRSFDMKIANPFARAIVAATAVAIAAPGAAAADTSADLARLKAHIGSVQTMTANFIQTDARGRSAAGTLQLKRPGKVRFQYGSGDLLLVANGKTLAFIDYQVGQKSSWPLGRTPRRPPAGCSCTAGPRSTRRGTGRRSS
jgi:outer membrane lipoprotein-sorting protein